MSEPFNPYAPPRADNAAFPGTTGTPADLTDASAGTRLINYIVDNVARFALAFVVGMALASAGIQVRQNALTQMGFALATVFSYYVVLEYFFGVTLGKLLTGTRVVDRSGGRPRFAQIVGRTLSRWVPVEPFSFFGSSLRGWHDDWSGTRVVKRR